LDSTASKELDWWVRLGVTVLCIFIWRLLATFRLPIGAPQLAQQVLSGSIFHGPLALFAPAPNESQSVVAFGLEPFEDALVVFWLVGLVSAHARKARHDMRRMWQYVWPLAAVLAYLRALGWVILVAREQNLPAMSPAGIVSLVALVVGSMALLGMGRLIDRFGIPSSYGVWLLFGIDLAHHGVQAVGIFLSRDAGDAQSGVILAAYAVASVALLGSTVIVLSIAQQRPRRTGAMGPWHRIPVTTLVGGFMIPVVVAAATVTFPIILLEGVLGMTPLQARVWSPESPSLTLRTAYLLTYCSVLVLVCRISLRPPIARSKTPVVVPLVVGVWLAIVVVLVPLIPTILLGHRPYLPLGGGTFVIAAAALVAVAGRLRTEGPRGREPAEATA
jgi:preprotein translocase subunit SecY